MVRKHLRDETSDCPPAEDIAWREQVEAALRRVDAPEGFTERLMARSELQGSTASAVQPKAVQRKASIFQRLWRPAWPVAYAGTALLAITVGTVRVEHGRNEQRRMEQQQVDQAAAQFDTALAVTNHALDQVSARLATTQFGDVQRVLNADGGTK